MTTTEKRKYHTIRVPVKKTSSEYYTMLRRGKVEPEKYCAYCGARLHRKYNKENGRWEDWSQFLNREWLSVCPRAFRRNVASERRSCRSIFEIGRAHV